jgi:hypothetical protein
MPAHRLCRSVVLGLSALSLWVATARADDKPKIAVLGLEVQTTGGAPDPESTKIARDLTDGLRRKALGGAGQYTMAPQSERELIDEKLMASCLDENAKCMAQIGAGLKADFLLYGRIDKNTKDCGDGYRVTLKLLDVAKAAEVSPPSPAKSCISLATAKDNAKGWGEKTYGKVVDNESTSTASNKDKDRDKDRDKDITTTTVVTGPSSPPKKGNGWKTATYVSLGLVVVAGTASGISALEVNSVKQGDDCAIPPMKQTKFACKHGDALSTTSYVGLGVAAGAALFTGVAYYMSSRSKEHASPVAGKPRKKQMVVTPVVTPDGGGATVQFDW